METERTEVDLIDGDVVKSFARAAVLASLLGASAYVAIPIGPVPITLQVLVVFLAGLYLGPYWGSVSVLLYLVAGAIGAPVFSGGTAGVGVLVGPTGGYLLGYAIAPLVIGLLVHDGHRIRDPATVSLGVVVAALVAATLLIYGLGAGWLAWVLELSATEAAAQGVIPFIPGELLKIAAAIGIVKSGRIDPT